MGVKGGTNTGTGKRKGEKRIGGRITTTFRHFAMVAASCLSVVLYMCIWSLTKQHILRVLKSPVCVVFKPHVNFIVLSKLTSKDSNIIASDK